MCMGPNCVRLYSGMGASRPSEVCLKIVQMGWTICSCVFFYYYLTAVKPQYLVNVVYTCVCFCLNDRRDPLTFPSSLYVSYCMCCSKADEASALCKKHLMAVNLFNLAHTFTPNNDQLWLQPAAHPSFTNTECVSAS